MKLEKGQLYRIEWVDITNDNTWQTEQDLEEWAKTRLVEIVSEWRFLKKIGEWYLFYSGVSKDNEPQYYDISALPKGVIKKAVKIK